MMYHEPVLLKESVEALAVIPSGIYVDATFGGGGHSKEILKHLAEGKLVGFDQDREAEANILEDDRFLFVQHNFIYLKKFLRFYDLLPVNGILADLGVSSHQFDIADRGFSIRFEADLDMRMNRDAELTAEKVLNEYPEDKLLRIFSEYGEVQNARKLTQLIIAARKISRIKTVNEFKDAIRPCIFRDNEGQYLAKVFQALRIEVNNELEALKQFLQNSAEALAPGGRLAVISYHSLEDRLVKNFMTKGRFEGEAEKDIYGNVSGLPLKVISRKAIVPGPEELSRNPRSRSAKLRVAEKTKE